MLTGEAVFIGGFAHRSPTFCCEHDLFSSSFEPFAHDLLSSTDGIEATTDWINIRRVKKIDAEFDGSVHNLEANLLVALPTKGHCSQTNLRHFQASPSHAFGFH